MQHFLVASANKFDYRALTLCMCEVLMSTSDINMYEHLLNLRQTNASSGPDFLDEVDLLRNQRPVEGHVAYHQQRIVNGGHASGSDYTKALKQKPLIPVKSNIAPLLALGLIALTGMALWFSSQLQRNSST
jgi:hypothetical protein